LLNIYIYIYIYIYMNSTTPKRHAEILRNWNIPFQLKKRNTYRNGIDNLVLGCYPWYLSLLTSLLLLIISSCPRWNPELNFKIIIIIIFNFYIDSGKLDRIQKRILTIYMDTKRVSFFIPAMFLFQQMKLLFFFFYLFFTNGAWLVSVYG
jgi:hypothetical protein